MAIPCTVSVVLQMAGAVTASDPTCWWMHHFQMPSRVETWVPSKNNPTKGPTSAPSYVRVSDNP
ncbi:hypothetical protein C3R29_08210 [Mycobacterium tuberculosis]|nr:hypothetical protein C3R29_08210 [Mycobacterium tuberculosis]